MFLFHTVQTKTLTTFIIFKHHQKIISGSYASTIVVALISIPPQNFARSQVWNYCYGTAKYKGEVASNGMMFIPTFVEAVNWFQGGAETWRCGVPYTCRSSRMEIFTMRYTLRRFQI